MLSDTHEHFNQLSKHINKLDYQMKTNRPYICIRPYLINAACLISAYSHLHSVRTISTCIFFLPTQAPFTSDH